MAKKRTIRRRIDDAPMRSPHKTVYILGAGFSQPAGMPLMRDFLPCALADMKKSPLTEDRQLAEELVVVLARFAGVPGVANVNMNNLEDVFCLAEAWLSSSSRKDPFDPRDVLKKVIARTSFAAYRLHRSNTCGKSVCVSVPRRFLAPQGVEPVKTHWLPAGIRPNCPPQHSQGVCIYEAFVAKILRHHQAVRMSERTTRPKSKPRALAYEDDLDVILTLNYDLLIEQSMESFLGGRIHYGGGVLSKRAALGRMKDQVLRDVKGDDREHVQQGRVIPLLKLHGSVNWQCQGGGLKTVTSVLDPPEKGPSIPRASGEIPLVPPTWRKDAVGTTIFAKMAQQAIQHLRRAAKIVIIGYSIPATDLYFRYLLASGIATPELPQIEVWDVRPKEEFVPRLEATLGSAARARLRYFDTGLLGFVTAPDDQHTGNS